MGLGGDLLAVHLSEASAQQRWWAELQGLALALLMECFLMDPLCLDDHFCRRRGIS